MSEDCFTLDDYIRKNNIVGSLNLRKKDKHIDKDELDASLDVIASKNAAKRGMKCGISKFDRFNDDSGNQSEEDECCNNSDEDSEMMDISENVNNEAENSSIRFAKEIQQMKQPDCCKIKKTFTTVESSMGVKVKSQQWRLQNSDNPQSNKVQTGRIQKPIRKKVNNIASKAGIFIEKGNFTYKFNDDPSNDSDDNAESIVGIVRNRPVTKIIRCGNNNRQNQNANGAPPVNINMNWNGFFKGMSECMKTVVPPPQPVQTQTVRGSSDDIQVKIAATELFDFLLAKRENSQPKVPFSEPEKPNSNQVNEYIVTATAGNGINMNVVPSVTNMPLNLRFA